MAKLKTLPLPEAKSKKSKKELPQLPVAGDIVSRFNDAADQLSKAQAVMDELAPELKELGMAFVFERNCTTPLNPKSIISSVNLVDAQGEIVQYTWKRANKACSAGLVEAFFKDRQTRQDKRANVNDYAAWKPKAEFDAKVFMVDGKFNQDRYDAFVEALALVAEEFDVPNPLTCTKVFGPTDSLHEIRFRDFTPEENVEMAEVLPTSEELEPIRPEKPEEEVAA